MNYEKIRRAPQHGLKSPHTPVPHIGKKAKRAIKRAKASSRPLEDAKLSKAPCPQVIKPRYKCK
jgi:hypothetical protein